MTSSNVPPRFAAALLALSAISLPALAQDRILSGRDRVDLTPAQQAVVDRITRAPETVNVSFLKATGTTDGQAPGIAMPRSCCGCPRARTLPFLARN